MIGEKPTRVGFSSRFGIYGQLRLVVMERRHQTIENSDLPKPWEDNPLTRAGWERHKDLLLSGAATGYGWRPNGWWMYERNMAPPSAQDQARKLYEMGELKGVELERCLVS